MKKICLTVVGLYCMLLHAFSQYNSPDSNFYVAKPLKVDEVNLVSSYYSQNGNHSAVTGGIGTERVIDVSNMLEVKFVGYDDKPRKHSLTLGLGIDYHSSASSAYVSKTGASKTGGSRIYPSINWTIENEKKGHSLGFGAYYSGEFNYHSFGLDMEYSKKNKLNGEFDAKLTTYFDQVKLIYPSELRPSSTSTVIVTTSASGGTSYGESGGANLIPSRPRNTITESLSYSQIFSQRLQGSVMVDLVQQNGYLGLPFHRVYFTDGTEQVESLPSTRYKFPIGARLNYFLGNNIILRSYYRYYTDDWGIKSQTASLEIPVKITPLFTVSPFYRYYTQTAADYFAPYAQHKPTDAYYTSNYAYSAFNSTYMGMGIKYMPTKGSVNTYELRFGHYNQTTDLNSNVITLALKFK